MADFEVIQEGKISNNTTANIVFGTIPQTYQHLEITLSWRSYATSGDVWMQSRMNGETGSEYGSAGWISPSGAGAVVRYTAWEDGETLGQCGTMASSGYTAGAFSVATFIVPNYTDTTQHKVMMCRGAQGSGDFIDGMSWAVVNGISDTSAVTEIDLYPYTGYYASGTSYMLAGYKG